jgi:F-type H+-transporting ATPase subunit gamma
MPSLKSIRKRITSVKNTQKITKAMKMVAAAKLRRAQDSVAAIRPYARRMKKVSQDLAARITEELDASPAAGAPSPSEEEGQGQDQEQSLRPVLLLKGRKEERIRLVVVTSDRGLAGAFNSNINRRTERFLVEHEGAQVTLEVIGKKGRDYLRRRNVTIGSELPGADPKTAGKIAAELAARLSLIIESGEADAVYVVYNEFKSVASQAVQVERLLPIEAPPAAAVSGAEDAPRTLLDFLYEPGQREVLQHLVPLYIQTELHRIFLESIAAEFGARMNAMDNASRNAKEMISRLTLQYNRARQAAITKELMEIVSGAEALKG